MNFIKLTSNEPLDESKIDLVHFMISKFDRVLHTTTEKQNESFIYTFVTEHQPNEENIDIVVQFFFDKFDDEVFFETNSDEDDDPITDKMLEELGKYMHNSMIQEKFDAGWRYGPIFSVEEKTNPILVTWDRLPNEYKVLRRDIFEKVVDIIANS